ncbi:MAG: polyprenyl synthetase family protein [Candidatus Cloacimonetes bacterium]|nr:polyprenyl synthetase family protein [Candidatus Cloacimonadota bacterium]
MLVQRYFDSRQKLVEEALDSYLVPPAEGTSSIHDAMRYAVFSGGKRLRPILLISTYEMLRNRKNIGTLKSLLPSAVALEFIHTASLIHDDLPSIDDSNERRGKPSVHKKFGEATAILAGDALLTKGFEALTDIKEKKKALTSINILARAVNTRGMIGGQAVDILAARKRIRINVLRFIHLKKTGALLQASMDMACAMYNAEENTAITLGNYALNLGLAYQIIDDILDEVGAFEFLGKEPYEDSRNRRSTYPSLIGLEKSKKTAEKLLDDSYKLIKSMPNNDILVEFINMIKERLP